MTLQMASLWSLRPHVLGFYLCGSIDPVYRGRYEILVDKAVYRTVLAVTKREKSLFAVPCLLSMASTTQSAYFSSLGEQMMKSFARTSTFTLIYGKQFFLPFPSLLTWTLTLGIFVLLFLHSATVYLYVVFSYNPGTHVLTPIEAQGGIPVKASIGCFWLLQLHF